MTEKGVFIMRKILPFVSYVFAAMSGICLVGGMALLSTGKEC